MDVLKRKLSSRKFLMGLATFVVVTVEVFLGTEWSTVLMSLLAGVGYQGVEGAVDIIRKPKY